MKSAHISKAITERLHAWGEGEQEALTVAAGEKDFDLIALDEALTRLGELDERQARIVELKFFADLTLQETADILGISTATVKREWTTAKAWLHHELTK